jgi:hypothetical protein
MAAAKSTRRELIFRTKQEREMLSLANASIKVRQRLITERPVAWAES